MPLNIHTVAPSDLIDSGRTKFNENDQAIADANAALAAQQSAHVGQGHPELYYTKSVTDALITQHTAMSKIIRFAFAFRVDTEKGQYCAIDDMHAMIPAAGSITRVTVVDDRGQQITVTANQGVYPVAAGNRLKIIGGANLIPGDELTPLKAGIILDVSGSVNNYQIVVYVGAKATFTQNAFSIVPEVTLT